MLRKCLLRFWSYISRKIDPNWIDCSEAVLFVKGNDPGVGHLRVTGNLSKVLQNQNDPNRRISFMEAYEVVFGKGTSTFIEERSKAYFKDEVTYIEKQYRIAGLTSQGRAILVVLTTRDSGLEKRVITAWPLKRKSKERKKLLNDCPHLESQINPR